MPDMVTGFLIGVAVMSLFAVFVLCTGFGVNRIFGDFY